MHIYIILIVCYDFANIIMVIFVILMQRVCAWDYNNDGENIGSFYLFTLQVLIHNMFCDLKSYKAMEETLSMTSQTYPKVFYYICCMDYNLFVIRPDCHTA